MTDRCETCAFNSGTVANRSEITRLKAELCIQTKEPFYCHEAIHKIESEGFTTDEAFEIAKQDKELRLCAGYVDGVRLLTDAGFYDRQPEWQKDFQAAAVELLCDLEDEAKGKQ